MAQVALVCLFWGGSAKTRPDGSLCYCREMSEIVQDVVKAVCFFSDIA